MYYTVVVVLHSIVFDFIPGVLYEIPLLIYVKKVKLHWEAYQNFAFINTGFHVFGKSGADLEECCPSYVHPIIPVTPALLMPKSNCIR